MSLVETSARLRESEHGNVTVPFFPPPSSGPPGSVGLNAKKMFCFFCGGGAEMIAVK